MAPAALRNAIESGDTVIAPGAWDAITARLLRHMGFGALYVPRAQTAKVLGTGEALVTLTELAMVAERVSEAVWDELPVIVEVGAGFGGLEHVTRAIEVLKDAGANAVVLSDAAFPPSRAPHGASPPIAIDAFTERIEAAVKARNGDDFLVMAALTRDSEALARARGAIAMGADLVVLPQRARAEELARLAEELADVPLAACSGADGPSLSSLKAMGCRLILVPELSLQASLLGVHATWKSVAETGHLLPQSAEAMPLINELLQIEEKWEVEQSTTEAGVEVPEPGR